MANNDASGTGPSDSSRSRGHRARGGRPSRNRGGRGGRGGRGNRQGNPPIAGTSDGQQGAPATPSIPVTDQSASHAARDGGAPRGRGRRGARGPRRGRVVTGGGQRTTIAASREFGGHLTTEMETEDQNSEVSTALNADASVFVPGQPFVRPRYIYNIPQRYIVWEKADISAVTKRQKMLRANKLVDCQSPVLLIFPRGYTKISAMDNTNASSVQTKFCQIRVSGPAQFVGLPPTCHASRSGLRIGLNRPTKSNSNPSSKSGGALDATRP
ncbi:hypothetical protein ANO14919_054720 [Xylariales sp. No.14919]|nr:hypothetical protein ANO14919_054720 [Xylariales sp. No.14919]